MAGPVLSAPPRPTTPSSTAPAATAAAPSSGTEVPGSADMTAAKPKTTTVPYDKRHRAPRKKGPAAAAAPAAAERKLKHLVVDSGAIIKGAGMTLASAAENFWTVPEVVSEIRDKKARHHLESLPFELKLREPSDEDIKFAAGFARQTGDLRSLSRVDLRVIALTYMLERQETGASHLRTSPVQAGTRVNSKKNGIAAPALVQESGENPEGSETPRAAADVDTSSSGNLDKGKGAVEEVMDADVGALCSAMKTAWTKEVVADEGAGKGESDAGCGTLETKQDTGDDAPANVISGAVVSHQDDESDVGEDGQETGDEEEGTEVEEEGSGSDGDDGDDDDDDDDDEWEPESNKAGDVKPQSACAAGAAAGAAVGGTAEFTADDFPTLGGSAAPKPAATPAPTPLTAPSSVVTPSEASSWSLMARSNPAPFQIPVKADPTPLPAAAPVEPETTAGHFEKGGVAAAAGAAPTDAPRPDGAKVGTSRILSTAAGFGVSGGGADDDDGEGWVNPSNIKRHKAAGIGLNGPMQSQKKGGRGAGGVAAATVASKCHAGCVTTDFAMQNVILQVGLPLLSLDGMAVRRVKQWILRCAACFKTCTEMGRLFCPVCGNASLDRVSCSVNAKTGTTYLHLRKNHKVNLRGSKFSIPAPNPAKGRFEGDLLLREDQLLTGIWAQKARRKEKDVSSMFGEDITANVGMTVSRSADIVVGYGRKNPNSARGRERRGKKGVKKRL